MRVSVIVTVYNLEAFVREALDSALLQTHAPHEVIVVNDCSTDGSDAVIRAFGDRVKYIKLPANVGGLRAAFRGLEEATGDIVAFLDGDDVWEPTKLEKCIREFERSERLILLSHGHVRVNRAGEPLAGADETHRNMARILRECATPEQRSAAYRESILESRGYWLGSAYTFRRAALDLDGFRRWLGTVERPEYVYLDLVLAPYLILDRPDAEVGFIDEVLFKYRIHGNNSCNDFRDSSRALRSVHRGYYTTLAGLRLIERAQASSRTDGAVSSRKLHLIYYDYLEALYRGNRIAACRLFGTLVRRGYLTRRLLAKEAIRLAVVVTGGPDLFLFLKSRAASPA